MNGKFFVVCLLAMTLVCINAQYGYEGSQLNKRDGAKEEMNKRGTPCACAEHTGVYWYPGCPPTWQTCYSAGPFGSCCYQS